MRQKKLVITLLVLLAFVVSGFTYAYWASSFDVDGTTDEVEIYIGSGDDVTLTLTVNDVDYTGDALVPASINGNSDWTNPSGTTKSVQFEFQVTLPANAFVEGQIILIETAYEVEITGALVANYGLVNVDVLQPVSSLTVNGTTDQTLTVTVTVTLDEPTSQAQYNDIATKPIVITFTFTPTIQ